MVTAARVNMSRIAGEVDSPERPMRRSRGKAVDTDEGSPVASVCSGGSLPEVKGARVWKKAVKAAVSHADGAITAVEPMKAKRGRPRKADVQQVAA
ncbi:hypothetical protein COCSUDRAFT_48793 [Coccomyxa subellipsoidea C-169]|uniref:Uncharacterized protein n=1 Tax=Coccomyxa subellipsoidea (strain C-169) TaxID=574566 RepID=I0YMI0_COCSC|nr:hypothetical protein COCSUDRAFT_48793 [Coccomyxa subellipsoidea C-169]EIE19599.1 hypothetical protein COCSUDRAFT_48793 [Coccomyxa subellipsoidea C-169]|eukprot:XP_005644143.1 hypothetical protein COCSUDRAFT_48793 [Coccomyxa subellipsoidea C-169]